MKPKKIHIYLIHHSHTDIGYTDLQEIVIANQVDYIKSAIQSLKQAYQENSSIINFKWNCETFFCVEQFLKECTEQEKEDFICFVKKGNIGLSANYLNFTDLADRDILHQRTKEFVDFYKPYGITVNAAMNADINGISLGAMESLVDNGIEFLYTNIHCHHGMYPLYQNQQPYFWESRTGKKLLVWNGEHYNLGNALEIVKLEILSFMTKFYFGDTEISDHMESIKYHIDQYTDLCFQHGYPYDFIPVSISGVFSDNAPPNPDIIKTIETFNAKYGDSIELEMVTISQLYEYIKEKISDVKTYQGDLTDWWAHGVPSTPYGVKHYKEAQRMYRLCERLDAQHQIINDSLVRDAQDNLLLYAEHTWGHSSTITNPYDTFVLNLDIRKYSYASKAHEACAKNLYRIKGHLGDKYRYYDRNGLIKAINTTPTAIQALVEFYIEACEYHGIELYHQQTKQPIKVQLSAHPRGVLVSFVDKFEPLEHKVYCFKEVAPKKETLNFRVAYYGPDQVKDIVNTYDPVSYTLPYAIENDFFRICYQIGTGVTSFYNKLDNLEMLKQGDEKFFTPIYERTSIRTDVYEERRKLGRNIRGLHAQKYIGKLIDIKILDRGSIFQTIELIYQLEGTYFSSIVLKMYHHEPRIDFKYKLAKTFSQDIESIFLPLSLNLPPVETYIDKGDVAFRPGIDQIPGTCMEYYLIDNGIVYQGDNRNYCIQTLDAPMIYMGNLNHHPIVLCDRAPQNNQRPIYSWIMNNIWETNFKMDLSGATEYCYSFQITDKKPIETCYQDLKDDYQRMLCFMI